MMDKAEKSNELRENATQPVPPGGKKSNKRNRDTSPQELTSSEPKQKKNQPSPQPKSLKGNFTTLLQGYEKKLIDLPKFIEEANKIKQAMNDANIDAEEFLTCIFFLSNRSSSSAKIKKLYKEENFIQWHLSEVAAYFTHYSKQNPSENERAIIKSLLLSVGSTQVNRLMEYPPIKEQLLSNFSYELISVLHPKQKLEKILNDYFSEEQSEQIKTKRFGCNQPQTILDLISSTDMKLAFLYWKQGFRPSSQQQFNKRLFQESDPQVLEIYQQIINDEQYEEFFSFPKQSHLPILFSSPSLIFLNNELIDRELYKQLLEKTQTMPNLNDILEGLSFRLSSVDMKVNYFQKLVYSFSLLQQPLAQPATSRSIHILTNRILPEDLIFQKTTTTAPIISHEWLKQSLFQNFTTADVLYIFTFSEIFRSSKQEQLLTEFFHFLKETHGFNKKLFKNYLLAAHLHDSFRMRTPLDTMYYITPEASLSWSPGSSHHNSPFKNKLYDHLHYHLPPIKQGCELLATELTVEERTNTVESLINFACNALQHLRGRALQTTLSVSKLGYFAQFISETITLTPEATPISPKAYYPISCILYNLITKTSPTLNGEFINSFLKTYRVQENRKMELTGIIFTQLILLSINNNPNKIIEIPSLITSLSNIQPGWINYLAHEVEINGQKKGLLTALLKMFHSNLAQKSAEILVNLLEQIHNNKDITLPISFLNEIADWQLNLQKRSQLNEQTQNLLATIYNHCIHQTQGTSQEAIFEGLRTQLLIKFNADPTQDSQAIHTKENHEFSKLIYSSWESALGETLDIRTEKYTKGQEILLQYISQKEGEIVKNRLQNESRELTLHFSLYLLGVRGSKYDAPCNSIKSEIMPYEELKNYIQQLTIKSQKPTMNNLERQNIQDVKQLLNLISMIAYYTENEQQSPEPFRINDKQEARNILLLELIDQVENPSCAQGPFIRLLIALEPTAEYRFPFLTRRSAQFYVNEYINAFYSQKTVEEQKQLIQQIYAQINDEEMPDEIDYVPEHAFSFLFTQFITEYEKRIGDISTKEIETLFSMERPQDYNPLIVAALNQHHQEQLAAKKSSTAHNPNGFFMKNTNGNNDNSSNMDIDMVSYKKG